MIIIKPMAYENLNFPVVRYDDIDDLLPSDFKEDWPPLSDEEIEERERQAEWQDYLDSIPDAAERNRNLK